MGKGKRNRLLHVEDNTVAPKKQQNKAKKQFVLPVWAKRAICIALLVAVLAGIIVAAVISGGTILRNRIVVESKSGKYDMNQQMATFILWQTMYQQASYEWQNAYYQSFFSDSKSEILTHYQSPEQYGITMAAYYTKEVLNSGLNSIKSYLIELVAGADAAYDAGLKFDADDKAGVKDVVSWVQNIYVNLGYSMSGIPFKNFLSEYVGDTFKTSDIEDAAKIMIMYSKYSDYKSYSIQNNPDENALQDFILQNPAGFFETKYYSFTGAEEAMIRKLFTDEFMTARLESTIAKHYANADRLAIMDLKDDALAAKLEEFGLNTPVKYTKTTTDGKDTYSPDALPSAISEYIFSSSNKAGTFAAISGEKCAYLVYFKETASTTEATIAYKEYQYETCKDKLIADLDDANFATIDAIKSSLSASIIAGETTVVGENTPDYLTDNEKAENKRGELIDQKAPPRTELPASLNPVKVDTFNPSAQNVTNEAPKSILDTLYAKDTIVVEGSYFVVNNLTESYLVKVIDIKKTEEGKETTDYTISYATFYNDPFASLLTTFEAEFNLYLIETKVEAPTYTMTFDKLEEEVVTWLMDTNFKELVLSKYANKDRDDLLVAKADSNKETFEKARDTLFENGVIEFKKSYATEKEFKTKYDLSVYDYIFNSKNRDSVSVIVGKDDRVFLVYVAPKGEDDTDDKVNAAIKEYDINNYTAKLTYTKDENTEPKSFYNAILEDLRGDGRKNTTTYKAAEDKAKAELTDLKNTESPKTWEGFTSINTTKPLEKNDTNTIPSVILNKIYPSGNKTTKVELTVNTYYQVDNNGTSYVYKLTEIDATTLACKVEYKTFEDDDYYSYYRAIKSKLDSSFGESSTALKYPDSISDGSYQDWLFKGEYKAAEGDNAATRTFERVKEDLTFIATINSSNSITGFTIYLVDEPAAQKNDEDATVYAGYQLYATEKEAQKALNKLNGLTGFELLDAFSAFKIRKEMGDNNEEGYVPGYVVTTSPTIGVDLKKADVADEKLKDWLFDENRKANDIEIVAAKDGKGFYLAVFASTEKAWLRTARTGWVNEAFANHMEELVKNYKINEEAMEKIEGVITTTTASTTTAPKS